MLKYKTNVAIKQLMRLVDKVFVLWLNDYDGMDAIMKSNQYMTDHAGPLTLRV